MRPRVRELQRALWPFLMEGVHWRKVESWLPALGPCAGRLTNQTSPAHSSSTELKHTSESATYSHTGRPQQNQIAVDLVGLLFSTLLGAVECPLCRVLGLIPDLFRTVGGSMCRLFGVLIRGVGNFL